MDIVSAAVRSKMMAAVPRQNSSPEIIVRRIVHSLGFRFRLHQRDLPGSPDIVLPRLHKVVFVHGCFWHRHGCRKTTTPASNTEFWGEKFEGNKRRDRRALQELRSLGWQSMVVWECQTKRREWLASRLSLFLSAVHGVHS